jgi:hypothetical protein
MQVGECDIARFDVFSNEMLLNIDVFHASVEGGIFCKCDCTLIVAVNRCGTLLHKPDEVQQSAQP